MKTLDQLHIGEQGIIAALAAQSNIYRRLLDLGFVPGARVCCLFPAVFGDPRAYLIKNTVIALRRSDARTILLKEESK